MKILILDDETERANVWRSHMESLSLPATVPNTDDVASLIGQLQETRLRARSGTFHEFMPLVDVDLLIVDYDLLGLKGHGWTTGAEVAYAARLLSRVGTIVVVNQFGTNAFDLTLRRAAFSHADLDVGSGQIMNKGLFKSSGFAGYRPWHWPDLHGEPKRLHAFSEFIGRHLDESVVSVLGFNLEDPGSSRFLSREVCSPIELTAESTFRGLAARARNTGLSATIEKDQKILQCLPDHIVSRICASILSRWTERFVIPNQDVLIDFPHAAMSMPWIMNGRVEMEAWNAFGLDSAPPHSLDITSCEVAQKFLSSRKVYWRGELEQIERPSGFSMSDVPDFVFCEDTSRFEKIDDAHEFSANVESYLNSRWVKAADAHVIYEPQAYLLV